MEAGIKNEKSIVVTEEVTASKVGSGLLPVYATPSMIALMEGTCAESVQSELAEGEGTVGVSVDIKHIAATPIGGTNSTRLLSLRFILPTSVAVATVQPITHRSA